MMKNSLLRTTLILLAFMLSTGMSAWAEQDDDNGFVIADLPHFEDFNEVSTPDLPPGWSSILDNDDYDARVETATIGSPITPPHNLRITTNDYEFQNVMAITPAIENLSDKRISFWARCNSSSNIPDLIIGTMSDPDNIATFSIYETLEADEDLTIDYQQFVIEFDDTIGDDEHMVFLHGGTPTFVRTIYIDNFLVADTPDEPVVWTPHESHDFGLFAMGDASEEATFNFKNIGVGTMTLETDDITITGDDAENFVLNSSEETIHLGPFESAEVGVTFSPEEPGDLTATLNILDETIALSGESVDPTIVDFPHLENFNDVETPNLPLGWFKINDNDDYNNSAVETTTTGTPHSPPQHARILSNDAEDQTMMLITPPLQNLEDKRIRFWARCNLASNVPDLILGTMGDPVDPDTFNPVDTILGDDPLTNDYIEFIYAFDESVGEDKHIAFLHGGSPQFNRSIFFDDVRIEDIPTEPVLTVDPESWDFGGIQINVSSLPKSFILTNDGVGTLTIEPDDISISGPDADRFNLYNLDETANLGEFESTTISVDFAPLNEGEKEATLHVLDKNIPLDGNGFDATITELPHNEDFTEVSAPDLPFGWTKIVDNPDYSSAAVLTTDGNSPLSDPYHARLLSNDYDDQHVMLMTPPVDELEGTRIHFFAKSNLSSNIPDLIVGTMSDPSDPETFTEVSTIEADEMTNSYHDDPFTVAFTSVGDDQFIAFKHGGTPNFARSILIDNITLELIPTEPVLVVDPEEYYFGSVFIDEESTPKTFEFMNNGGGVMNITPADISLTGDYTDQFVLENLEEEVNLGAGEAAVVSLTFAPTTPGMKTVTLHIDDASIPVTGNGFDPFISVFPWEENFLDDWTGDPEAPLGWSVVNGISGSYWEQSSGNSHSGDYSARSYQGSASNNLADEWLISPPLDLDEVDNPMLSFYGLSAMTPDGTREYMRILIVDQVYDNVDDLHDNAILLDDIPFTGSWAEYTINISAYSGTQHVVFHYYITEDDDASFNWIHVDDVKVEGVEGFTLTMEDPDGQGSVTPEPGDHFFTEDDEVTLTADPADGWEFSHWTGNVYDEYSAVTTITMDADQTVKAYFEEEEDLPDDVVDSFPWTEDFEADWIDDPDDPDTPEAPEEWVVVNGAEGAYWQQSGVSSHIGDYSARSYQGSASSNLADEWMISPAFNLDNPDATQILFHGYSSQSPDGTRENMRIMLLDQVYDNVDDLHDNAIEIAVVPFTSDWEEYILDLEDYDGVKHIAFNYYITEEDDASFNWIYVDDIIVGHFDVFTLTMMAPDGSGEVAPEVGDYDYSENTEVAISAEPAYTWSFDKWEVNGEFYSDEADTTITMDEDKDVQAFFTAEDSFTLTMLAPDGDGSVVPDVGDHPYLENDTVDLSATAGMGYTFSHWTGDVDDPDSPVTTIVMDGDKTVQAFFVDFDGIDLPWTETFDGVPSGEIPSNWARTHDNWAVNDSDNAGGEAPEMRFNWSPASEDQFRVTSPMILTSGYEALLLSFDHHVNNFSSPGIYTVRLIAIADGDEHIIHEWVDPDNVGPEEVEFILTEDQHGVGSDDFYIAWELDGDSNDINQWYFDNVHLGEAPDLYEVTFHVMEDSADEDPIEGASINIDGDIYHTDENGVATMMLADDITYTADITAAGYVAEEVTFTVDGQDKDIDVHMMDDIQDPFNLEIVTEGQEPGDALFIWNDYGVEYEFRYDDGVVDAQLGFQGDWNSVMGAAHHNDAVLLETTWYLTSEGGPHNNVKVWVLGLDANGMPNRNDVIYTAENVPNNDNEWNTYEFTEPVEAPNGFFVGLSYDGFLGLAVDDGVGEPWDFVPGTQFGVFDITDPTSAFTDISEWDFEVNFLLRAYGANQGDIDFGKQELPMAAGPAPELIPMDKPVDAGNPFNPAGQKAFLGFNVFLNDDLVAEEIEENEYLFADLPGGDHTAGVQSVYTTGSSEIHTIDFTIEDHDPDPDMYTVTFDVIDEDGHTIEDAIVTFDGHTYDAGHYVIEDVEEGTYDYMVEKDGYHTAEGDVTVDADVTVEVTLVEEEVETFAVTFLVDLSLAIEHGVLVGFDPEMHHIMMTGEMFGWPEPDPAHEDMVLDWIDDDPMTYAITLHLEAGTYEYKYFSNLIGDGWEGGEWEGGDDRMVEVTGEMEVHDHFGFTDDEVSVIDTEPVSLNIYPNPARSTLYIEADATITEIRMIDMLGQVVYSTAVGDQRHELNVSSFDTGVYFIQLTTEKGVITHRVQVSR